MAKAKKRQPAKKKTAVKLPRAILFEILRSLSLTPIAASLSAKSA